MKRKIFFVLALLCLLAINIAAQTLPSGPRLKNIVSGTQIGVRTDQEGLFGSISPTYTTVFDREFNSGQVTCYPAWEAWTGFKQYNLTNINNRINWLEDHGKTQMMHLLVGPDLYFPDWFKNSTYTNAQLEDMLHDWIKTIIQSNSNATKVEVWNVVNEAISFYPPYEYGTDVKWHQLGFEADVSGLSGSDYVVSQHPVYIRKAFEYARQYTNAKLELRDSMAEFPDGNNSTKYRIFYQLTKHLLNKGVPLDAVGFQVHINIQNDYNWNGFKNNINRYRALGLETYITELDIGDTEQSWNSTKAQEQRAKYYTVTQIAMDTDMEYFHVWGLIDGLDAGWRTNESPLLFDANYNPKPAYYGVQDALVESANSGSNEIIVRAGGVVGDEQLQLLIDDIMVRTWTLSTSMQNLTYATNEASGNLKVYFTNDQGSRDVQVDYIVVNGITHQAEDQAVNTGVYQGQCGGSYSEWLHCNGYIDFGILNFGPVQAPYGGNPRSIPGLIQAEDYDLGGEGLAYHDTDAANQGNAYRTDGVDVENTTDSGGGYNVGWIENGEWLEFTVDVSTAGTYDFDLRVAALNSAGTLHIEFDGNDVTGPITIPVTGGWQTFTTVSKTGISLPAGQQIMRIAMDASMFNINWINITRHNNPPSVSITNPANNATFIEGQNITISANASDSDGNVTKVEFFHGSTKISEDTSAPYSITWNNVPVGNYTLTAKATDNEGASTTSAGINITVNVDNSGTNLLLNGNFENGTSSWSGQGCTISASSSAHTGTGAVLTSSRPDYWAGPIQTITSAVANHGPGNYNVSAWMRMVSGTANGAITIRLVSDAGTTYAQTTATVSTNWSQISGVLELTWSGILTLAEFYLETPPQGTTNFYADDCFIAAVNPNLLVNGNFENGITSWTGSGCTISTSTTVHSGSGSVRASSRTASWAGPRQNIIDALIENGPGNYTASAWMKVASGSGTGAITVKLVSGAGTSYTLANGTVNTGWSQISGILNLTWSGTLTTAEIYLETPSGTTVNFYADDCALHAALAKQIVPGNSPDASEPELTTVPKQFSLFQNYPNPFNPQTTLHYVIPERVPVRVEIFNLMGQSVALLVDKVQEPGEYQVEFHAHYLESGMYLCRLQAGNFSDMRKMLFVK